jgi:hypothetical protein
MSLCPFAAKIMNHREGDKSFNDYYHKDVGGEFGSCGNFLSFCSRKQINDNDETEIMEHDDARNNDNECNNFLWW